MSFKRDAHCITAVCCDLCDERIEVHAYNRKDVMRLIGMADSYKRHGIGRWGRVSPAALWSHGRWQPGDRFDLCPRCYVRQDQARQERQATVEVA